MKQLPHRNNGKRFYARINVAVWNLLSFAHIFLAVCEEISVFRLVDTLLFDEFDWLDCSVTYLEASFAELKSDKNHVLRQLYWTPRHISANFCSNLFGQCLSQAVSLIHGKFLIELRL